MATVPMLRDQLAELRIMINHNDPAHVEAEAAFAAMVAEIMHQAEIGPSSGFARAMRSTVRPKGQVAEPLAKRLMLGTAEAYDPLAEQLEQRRG